MEAVRVPPSARITSQSTHAVRSPSASRSVTARNDLPMSRWISMVRPPCRPRVASRGVRVSVARGIMAYSLVIHPRPHPFINCGTPSSIEAVQITWVSPSRIRAEPSALEITLGVISTGRISAGVRLSPRTNFPWEYNRPEIRFGVFAIQPRFPLSVYRLLPHMNRQMFGEGNSPANIGMARYRRAGLCNRFVAVRIWGKIFTQVNVPALCPHFLSLDKYFYFF